MSTNRPSGKWYTRSMVTIPNSFLMLVGIALNSWAMNPQPTSPPASGANRLFVTAAPKVNSSIVYTAFHPGTRSAENASPVLSAQSAVPPAIKPVKPATGKRGIQRSTSPRATAQTRHTQLGPGDVPCGNGQPRNQLGNCPREPFCAKMCTWNMGAPKANQCWSYQGKNVVTGYSNQRTPDGKLCAWTYDGASPPANKVTP